MFAYIGGKNKIGKWIFEQMPKVRWKRYVEVFGGAMWMYIKRDIQADEIIYNDYNPFLYNIWYCMVYERDKLLTKLTKCKLNDKETFKSNKLKIKGIENNREEFINTIPNIDVAITYIYQLTHCFSGDISGGMKKDQNSWESFISKLNSRFYVNKLNNISKVLNDDCENIIKTFDGDDVMMYVDPPYYEKEHLYGFHNFDKDKHYSLAETLKKSECLWALSYYDYDDLRYLYPENEFTWMRKEFFRTSSPLIGKPGKGEEVLIFPTNKLREKQNKRLNVFFK